MVLNSPNELRLEGQGDMVVGAVDLAQAADGSVRITLDWIEENGNLLLFVVDPEGRSLGYDHTTGTVTSTIDGATYSGPDAKPQWVEIDQAIAGTYLLAAYVDDSDGPVTAKLRVDAEEAPPQIDPMLVVGGVGIAVVALLGLVLYRRRRPKAARTVQPAVQKAEPTVKPSEEQRFCESCGKQIEARTEFCPFCGDKQGV